MDSFKRKNSNIYILDTNEELEIYFDEIVCKYEGELLLYYKDNLICKVPTGYAIRCTEKFTYNNKKAFRFEFF